MAKKINELSGMPQIQVAFNGWLNPITLATITQSVVDGLLVDTQTDVTFQGVIQPLKAKEIENKPEGFRAFKWLQIHCIAGSLNLDNNDRIIYNNTKYKVMGIYDYSLDNFIEYHIVEDDPQ
jgi:hypothetical protein